MTLKRDQLIKEWVEEDRRFKQHCIRKKKLEFLCSKTMRRLEQHEAQKRILEKNIEEKYGIPAAELESLF